MRFWGPYLLLIFLLRRSVLNEAWPLLFISYLLFYNIYDYLSYENDTYSILREVKAEKRVWKYDVDSNGFLTIKILVQLFLNVSVLIFYDIHVFLPLCIWEAAVAAVFFIHNRLREDFRFISFFLLYMLKSLVFGAVALRFFNRSELYSYIVFSILFSCAHLPKYMCLKLGKDHDYETLKIRVNKYLFIQPITCKNILLLIAGIFLENMHWIVLYVDSVTLIELLFRKITGRKVFEG
jgi:hypothetical protein